MTAKTSFGQWLKQRRKTLDLTREELAQRIGCAVVTLYKIEADERRPSKQIAALLAEHLNIPASERAAFISFARGEAGESDAPWGTPFRPPTNLPAQLTPLIGRDEDVISVRKRLLHTETRLLTLIGPPGIGKTRLSLQVGFQMLNDFADGVFFVPLAAITDADLVPVTIANSLDVPDVGPRPPLERLKNFLRDKALLLILDNFEQILTAAPQIAELLSACPLLKLLVTSRSPLRIRPERQFPVPALALPDPVHLTDIATVSEYSAVRLFTERAQAVNPNFSITHENSASVAAICTRLDGLPLAIELISARVKLLPPSALLERLRGRLLLQSDGLRDIEPRHRTLNAAIDWSYQFLSANEQILFRRLGIFVGGWTLEAAEAVCAENLNLNILDGLASLLDKNLVKREGESRFTMLETIREYALERLAASGELEDMRRRHADYFVKVTREIGTRRDELHNKWDQLEIELNNIRTALVWSRTEETGEIELRLAVWMIDFWLRRGYLSEAMAWLTEALTRSKGLTGRAQRKLRAYALENLGMNKMWRGDLDAAEILHEESIAIFRELGEVDNAADGLGTYGMLFVLRGDLERAIPMFHEALDLFRQLGNTYGISQMQCFLGNVAYIQNNTLQAKALWQESLIVKRVNDEKWMMAGVLANLAMVALDERDYQLAETQLVESLILFRELSERLGIFRTLEEFARLAAERDQPDLTRAARLYGATEAFRETFNAPGLSFERLSYERGITSLRARLDDSTLKSAWAEGRKMSLEQAIAYALET